MTKNETQEYKYAFFSNALFVQCEYKMNCTAYKLGKIAKQNLRELILGLPKFKL